MLVPKAAPCGGNNKERANDDATLHAARLALGTRAFCLRSVYIHAVH